MIISKMWATVVLTGVIALSFTACSAKPTAPEANNSEGSAADFQTFLQDQKKLIQEIWSSLDMSN